MWVLVAGKLVKAMMFYDRHSNSELASALAILSESQDAAPDWFQNEAMFRGVGGGGAPSYGGGGGDGESWGGGGVDRSLHLIHPFRGGAR